MTSITQGHSFTDELRVIVAAMQARKPDKAGVIGRAHALIVDGYVVDNGDGTGKVLSSDLNTWYEVNGVCACDAAAHGQRCKHLEAWDLHQVVQKRLAAPAPPGGAGNAARQDATADHDDGVPDTIPTEYIEYIHGRAFVRFVGLLALAHARGLQRLEARFISVTGTLALAEATATFADGKVFTEAADATPENVQFGVKAHFARMALTRAKARTLRDALNIGICAVEELD